LSYINEIKEEFEGLSHSTTWELITNRTYGDYYHLLHPCRVEDHVLEKYIPDSISVSEILPRVQQKKKDLAKKYDISKFPPDREPGFLGQAALYEVVREFQEDLSYYLHSGHQRGDSSWHEGFGLFDTLIGITYLRDFFGFDRVDPLQLIFEVSTPSKVIIKLEKIWMYRLITNISALVPRITDNQLTREIMKNLIQIQDAWGLTKARIQEWTGLRREDTEFYRQLMSVMGLVHRCRLVPKNTGIVRTLRVNSSLTKRVNAEDLLCSSWHDNNRCFISFNYSMQDDVEGDCFTFEAYTQNIDNYDSKLKLWTIPNHDEVAKQECDIHNLFCNSDLTLPDNSAALTERDVVFIALLASMPVEFHPEWKKDVVRRLVKGCGIPLEEAELGLRNIFRKHLIRHQYTFALGNDRMQSLIYFNDSIKKTLPFLGDVLPNVPQSVLRANDSMTCGSMYIYYPPYLIEDIRYFINSKLEESDLNSAVYDLQEWKHAETSNILSLLPFS
jgi:hypothetical protein